MREQIDFKTQTIEYYKSPKLLAFYDLENHTPGTEIGQWPLHITVIPPFEVDSKKKDLAIESIKHITGQFSPLLVRLGETAVFGTETVRLVDNPEELRRRHTDIVDELLSRGFVIDTTWCRERYTPHVTLRDPQQWLPEHFALTSLTIACKSGDKRQILEVVDL